MTHRMKSLFLGCLLLGQFYCQLGAMNRSLISFKPAEKLLQLREQIRLQGSQVPLSSWLRKDIVHIASSRQKFLLLDQAYAHILRSAGIIFILFIAYYSLRALPIYIQQLQFERKIKKAQSHRNLIETRILPHFPDEISMENCGSIIADFLDHDQQLTRGLRQAQARYKSQQKLLLETIMRTFADYVSKPLAMASLNFLLFTSVITIILWYFCVFILYLAPCISFFYGPQEAVNTLSLLIYHDYDKFLLVTAPFLIVKYLVVIALSMQIRTHANQMRELNP